MRKCQIISVGSRRVKIVLDELSTSINLVMKILLIFKFNLK